jgi:hypothetical protein
MVRILDGVEMITLIPHNNIANVKVDDMTDEIRKAKLHLWKLLKAIPADHPEQNADLYEALKTDHVIRQEVKDKGA